MSADIAFQRERARLLSAFGKLTEGGIVEHIEPVGAASILPAERGAAIDIALSVWPFPPEPARLETMGYTAIPTWHDASVLCYANASDTVHLIFTEAGDQAWSELVVGRDYLLHTPAARDRFVLERAQWRQGEANTRKAEFFQETWRAAQRWWVEFYGFSPVKTLAQELKALDIGWYIAGGWAIDLYLGRVTRVHQDLDVVVARADQLSLQEYMSHRGWTWVAPIEGKPYPWQPHVPLDPPLHQAHAHRNGAFIDFLLTDIEEGVWRYRRDPSILRAAAHMSLKTDDDLPIVAPELVLLFKSKNTSDKKERPQDQSDFEKVAPHLNPEPRAWLRWALLATNPAHPWLDTLG